MKLYHYFKNNANLKEGRENTMKKQREVLIKAIKLLNNVDDQLVLAEIVLKLKKKELGL